MSELTEEQRYLTKEILEKGYDTEKFVTFLLSLKEGGRHL